MIAYNVGNMKSSKHNSEQALVEAFNRAYVKTLQKGRNVRIFTEANTNWGTVDILSVHFDKSTLCHRCKEVNGTSPEFSNLAAYAMAYLSESSSVTMAELANYLKANNGQLFQVIEILTGRGLAYVYKNGKVRARSTTNTFAIKDILAFEAKISDWKKAITQAERHLWFTNSSFVIMPNLTRQTIDKIRFECANRGIGLITQSGTKSFKIVAEPLRKRHVDSFFSWKLNELLIDRSIGNGQSCDFETP